MAAATTTAVAAPASTSTAASAIVATTSAASGGTAPPSTLVSTRVALPAENAFTVQAYVPGSGGSVETVADIVVDIAIVLIIIWSYRG